MQVRKISEVHFNKILQKVICASLIICSYCSSAVPEEVLTIPDRTSNRLMPSDGSQVSNDTFYQKKYDEMKQKNVESQKKIEGMQAQSENYRTLMMQYQQKTMPGQDSSLKQGGFTSASSSVPLSSAQTTSLSTQVYPPPYAENISDSAIGKSQTQVSPAMMKAQETAGQGAQFFSVSSTSSMNNTINLNYNKKLTVIPGGSFVKAKVISGAETSEGSNTPIVMQLDYAYQGPNRRIINFKDCIITAKASANLAIERVEMKLEKLSCVRENNEAFQIALNGFVSGPDSNFAVKGTYISHQDKVILAALLDGLVKTVGGVGSALTLAQQSQTVAAGNTGSAQVATNFTGSLPEYLAGAGISGGASSFGLATQFYLTQALKLFPTIGVGSGQDVWAIILDQVAVPSLFTDTNYDNAVPY